MEIGERRSIKVRLRLEDLIDFLNTLGVSVPSHVRWIGMRAVNERTGHVVEVEQITTVELFWDLEEEV